MTKYELIKELDAMVSELIDIDVNHEFGISDELLMATEGITNAIELLNCTEKDNGTRSDD